MGQLVFQATLGGAVNLIGPNIAGTVNFTLPSADGSSGQALSTNGSGTLAFGTLAVGAGGTGQTSYTDGQLLIGNSTGNTLTKTTLTAGSGITITNGSGAITIASSGGSGDVVGPASATANGIALFNSTTGKLIKDSASTDGKIQGITIGRGGGSVSSNTAVGVSALAANTTGSDNTVMGDFALYLNSTGQANTAIGRIALANTTYSFNTAVGYYALAANTSGGNNTAMGVSALQSNTTASNNTAVGYQAGYSTTTGTGSTALGYQAGYTNTTNSYNTSIGYQAGKLTTGTNNTFVGLFAGSDVTSGAKNTIIGGYAGNSGGLDIRTASNYIVLSDGDGNPRGFFDNSGNYVVGAIGAVSSAAAGAVLTQNGYVRSITTGSTNSTTTFEAYSTGASQFRFYVGMGGTVYATSTTITAISDQRLKENIRDLDEGLATVMALKPRKFDWKTGKGQDIKNARGFIAQEFETVLPDMIEEWRDPAPEGEEAYKAINANLIPTLVKAIQELKAEFDAYKATHP
jgi:hypothetical protein